MAHIVFLCYMRTRPCKHACMYRLIRICEEQKLCMFNYFLVLLNVVCFFLRCRGWHGEVLGYEEDRQAQLAAQCPFPWGSPTSPHPNPPDQIQGSPCPTHFQFCLSGQKCIFNAHAWQPASRAAVDLVLDNLKVSWAYTGQICIH